LLCILAFYVPDFGTTGKLIYAFVTYLCLSFLYTLVNIPFCAMLPFLTNDSRERTTLSAVRILLGSLGRPLSRSPLCRWLARWGKASSSTASSIRRWFSALLPPSSCW
jgi:Na+/melibiose symporter-like transporter